MVLSSSPSDEQIWLHVTSGEISARMQCKVGGFRYTRTETAVSESGTLGI